MAVIPIDEAQLVSLVLESITYGMYLVSFGMCVRALLVRNVRSSKPQSLNWPLVGVALLMFALESVNIMCSIHFNLDAFIRYRGPGGPSAVFHKISYPVNVIKTSCLQMMALVGDGMLIYRCLVVFFYDWRVVIAPMVLWIGNAVCAIAIIYISATLRTDVLITANQLSSFIMSFLVITLATNLLTTGMIVWRLWGVSRDANRVGGTRSSRLGLNDVIRIFVESAFLYTSLVLATFVTELVGSNAVYCAADVMIHTVGISFNLIIVRIYEGVAVGDEQRGNNVQVSAPLHFRSRQLTTTEAVSEAGLASLVDQDEQPSVQNTPIDPTNLKRTGNRVQWTV